MARNMYYNYCPILTHWYQVTSKILYHHITSIAAIVIPQNLIATPTNHTLIRPKLASYVPNYVLLHVGSTPC